MRKTPTAAGSAVGFWVVGGVDAVGEDVGGDGGGVRDVSEDVVGDVVVVVEAGSGERGGCIGGDFSRLRAGRGISNNAVKMRAIRMR